MTRTILALIAFVLLAEHLSTFLVLLVSIMGTDIDALKVGIVANELPFPPMEVSDLQLLWVFLGSVVIAGLALILVFVDMAFFHMRNRQLSKIFCGAHFFVMLVWIILGATIFSRQYAQENAYFSVFINQVQFELILGSLSSFLAFVVLQIKRSR